ncbi:hypothetical protein HYH02_006190 [Chlamydomonas schloesseri]|uniref:Structural maintenance of chromosomes protein 5 n=1 Tax=Chlamydomonas schloesseri TaxID=2026947 RepID=A0A836B6M1_9CHLO|nr:hypothetical protein HYH02_006190 [Chlamydomonas schloesseri]|eukprot:KAG2448839.1 hypothetical protein HYH02_006190 [Chlamydomonas schloesseri]
MPRFKRELVYESDDEEFQDARGEEEEEPAGVGEEEQVADTIERYRSGEGAGPSHAPAGAARPDAFAKGAVKLVRMHDFMTYNGTVTVRPGARLNLVLGPNGTGKSSLVCALCIGLGGSLKNLGRAEDTKSFVRDGANSCWIETTLSSGGEGRDFVIRRTITLRSERVINADRQEEVVKRYSSDYKINGVDRSQKDVDKLIKKLNIQFDNLCQFLPQDKVVEFSRMDKYQLLAATEKALGDSSLYDQHRQLVELRKEEKIATAERDKSSAMLEKLKAQQAQQQREYERFSQRQQLTKEARALKRRAKWLEVAAKLKSARAAKDKLRGEKAKLDELEAQQQSDTAPIQALEGKCSELRRARQDADKETKRAHGSFMRAQAAISKHDEDVQQLTGELMGLNEEAKRRQEAIAAAEQRLAAASQRVASMPERSPELEARVGALNQEISDLRNGDYDDLGRRNELQEQAQQKQSEIHGVRAQIDRLDSRKYQLLQRMSRKHRNLDQLYAWVEQHRHDGTFQGPVFGPIALEMTVAPPPELSQALAVTYVESACASWLATFLVTCQADEKVMTYQATQMNCGFVRTACSDHRPDQPFEVSYPHGTAEQYARYGVLYTLDQLVQAPPIVMHALVRQCRLNTAFIGNTHAAQAIETIAHTTPIKALFAETTKFEVVHSQYNPNTRHVNNRQLQNAQLLCEGSNDDDLRAQLLAREKALKQAHEALAVKITAVEFGLQQRQAQMQAKGQEVEMLVQRMNALKQQRLKAMADERMAAMNLMNKRELPDPMLRQPVLKAAIDAKIGQHVELLSNALAAAHGVKHVIWEGQVLELRLQEAGAQLEALRVSSRAREQELTAARNAVEGARVAYKAHEADYMRSKEAAEDHYKLEDEDKDEVRRLEAEGTPASELLKAAEEKAAEAEAIVVNNTNVIEAYQSRQRQIEELTTDLQGQEQRVQMLTARVEEIKGSWLPVIKDMVTTINASFSHNFKEIGCAGEVRLYEDPDDFDKFAIEILVQFRTTESMQLLTSTRQSGGERSVSTILYLIALQAVTQTPFRVVDEINQGMDPINERKVFQQLVSASTEADTPQCFMLTPKLLSDLVYSGDVTVLQIMNGASVPAAMVAVHNAGKSKMYGKRQRLNP